MVLAGIFLLRNRLGGEEATEKNEQKAKTVAKRKSRSHKSRISIRDIEKEISFQSWIGAG